MAKRVERRTVDLTQYPDLVVIYLGMRVNRWFGFRRLLGLGPQIQKSVAAQPEGLLLHENLFFSLRHLGMRQYWRDWESLERWTRSEPHQRWWKQFLKDSGGTGFWHESYFLRGGMEAIYDDVTSPLGFLKFAPSEAARGGMFSARRRAGLPGDSPTPVLDEQALYAGGPTR
ncbi:MAG TPA: DUF4188 domain-containing protein [Dehalococcoidia bacterium]|nr:DUF4188 domain-containing protein [Dehalococcoidia bacterium]